MDNADHVLVVENDAAICEVIRQCLSEAGYLTSIATTYAQAIDILHRATVDFALIDMMLTDGPSGIRLALAARARNIGCVVMSGHPEMAELTAEADLPTLAKPFRLAELLTMVRAGIEQSRART